MRSQPGSRGEPMRLATRKADLVECLSIVNRAVSSRSSIQVLSGILVDCSGETPMLSATDMEISLKAPLAARIDDPGSLVLPARILTDIATSLPAGEVIIEVRAGETQVEVRSGESFFSLHAMDAADFPQFPVFPAEHGFTVQKTAFLETIA